MVPLNATRGQDKKLLQLCSEMWWLIGSAPGFWGRGPGFESGFSRNDPDALQVHCVYCRKSQGREGNLYR